MNLSQDLFLFYIDQVIKPDFMVIYIEPNTAYHLLIGNAFRIMSKAD